MFSDIAIQYVTVIGYAVVTICWGVVVADVMMAVVHYVARFVVIVVDISGVCVAAIGSLLLLLLSLYASLDIVTLMLVVRCFVCCWCRYFWWCCCCCCCRNCSWWILTLLRLFCYTVILIVNSQV